MALRIIGNGKKWREGKVRPLPGNSPHDRLVSRGMSFTFWRVCDDPFPATGFRNGKELSWTPRMRFPRHGGIYLVRWGSTSKTKIGLCARIRQTNRFKRLSGKQQIRFW